MLSRWMVLLVLFGLSGCSGLKLQLEVQRGNQTMRVSAKQALGHKDRVALHVQVPQDSFVYLAHSPAQRDTRPIYPVTGPLRLSAGKLHRVPEDGSFLPLDDIQPGESLCVILSPKEIKGAMPRCVSTGGPSRDGNCGKDCEPKMTNPKDRGPEGLTIVPLHLSQCIPAIRGAEPQRRALLIGIDHYLPPSGSIKDGTVSDLKGALNDVDLMAKVLRSRFRFRFEDHELCILRDEEATRAGILQAIQSFLIEPTRQGDQVFLYFAGHGSTFENKLSPDGQDETIVPADRNRQVPDIHDKELHRLLGQVLDRGGELIAAFDSCFSGNVTMDATGQSAQSEEVHIRGAEPVRIPVKTLPPLPTPLTARGAVILEAADSSQRAQERRFGDRFHGIFTVGLVRALYLSQPGDSVAMLLRSAAAFVRASAIGNEQHPKLEASSDRGRRPLFGGPAAAQDGVYVMVVNKSQDGILLISEGLGLGIGVGARLERPGTKKLTLTVEKVLDLSSSLAKVVDGDADSLQVGEPLRVLHFGTSSQKSLRIAMEGATAAVNELSLAMQALLPLRGRTGAHLTLDEESEPPTHRLRYNGSGWQLVTELNKRVISRWEPVTTRALLGMLPSSAVLAVDWPLDADQAKHLSNELLSHSIQLVSESEPHDYVVRGRYGESPRFALVQPTANERKTMPRRSEWVMAGDLAGQARKLMRQFRWLTLESQSEDKRDFPYKLEVADLNIPGRVLREGDTTYNGEHYLLRLVHPEETPRRTVEPRYVYVCSVDSSGSMALLFGTGGDKNRVPLENYTLPKMALISIHPSGKKSTDTFVLLTNSSPLSEPDKLCTAEAHMATCAASSDGVLCALLQGSLIQGIDQKIQVGRWSVERITVTHQEHR